MKDTEAAWLAGLIDGDGCFTATKRTKGGVEYRSPVMLIDMTHEATIRYIAELFGATYYPTSQPGRKQAYRVQLMGNNLRSLLAHCMPFFVTKKVQAEIVAEWMDLKSLREGNRSFMPKRQRELYEALGRVNQGTAVNNATWEAASDKASGQ
jgi:hypothetical protein